MLFLIARIIDGFTGGNIAIARAYVVDVTDEKDRPKGMAIIGISFGVGFILGPALGGILYNFQGHMIAALVSGSLSFIAFLLTILFLKEPHNKTSYKKPAPILSQISNTCSNPAIAILFFLQLIFMCLFSGFETTFSVFTNDVFGYNERQNSILFLYIGVLAFLVQGYLSRKSNSKFFKIITIGTILTTISYYSLGFISNTDIYKLYFNLALLSVGFGLVNTYLPSLITITANKESSGTVMGMYESINSLGRILGPLIAYLPIYSSMNNLYFIYGLALSSCFFILMISKNKCFKKL